MSSTPQWMLWSPIISTERPSFLCEMIFSNDGHFYRGQYSKVILYEEKIEAKMSIFASYLSARPVVFTVCVKAPHSCFPSAHPHTHYNPVASFPGRTCTTWAHLSTFIPLSSLGRGDLSDFFPPLTQEQDKMLNLFSCSTPAFKKKNLNSNEYISSMWTNWVPLTQLVFLHPTWFDHIKPCALTQAQDQSWVTGAVKQQSYLPSYHTTHMVYNKVTGSC